MVWCEFEFGARAPSLHNPLPRIQGLLQLCRIAVSPTSRLLLERLRIPANDLIGIVNVQWLLGLSMKQGFPKTIRPDRHKFLFLNIC